MLRKKGKPEGIVLVFIGLAILFGLTDSLNKLYRAERARRAESHFGRGEQMTAAGRPSDAVEEYRAALTFAHNDPRYEMALANALASLGRLNEAASHLSELHERSPEDAKVDLTLARVEARQGRTDDAVASYHQAIYGLWRDSPAKHRTEARFEVVDLLASSGQKRQALADLLALAEEAPDDSAVLDRAGNLLLRFGAPEQAAEVFGRAATVDPHDAIASLGIARADYERGNYTAAISRLHRALRLDPANADARRLLDVANEVVALDPSIVSLSAAERYARSRTLLERAAAALSACRSDDTLLDDARALLGARRHRDGDTPAAIALAETLWRRSQQACPQAPVSDPALARLMAKLAK